MHPTGASPWPRTLHYVALVMSFGLLFLIGWRSYSSVGELEDADRWIVRGSEVISEMEHLSSILNNVEILQRTYALTGDDRLSPLYAQAVTAIPGTTGRIRALIVDNGPQQGRPNLLESAITKNLDLLEANVVAPKADDKLLPANGRVSRIEYIIPVIAQIINEVKLTLSTQKSENVRHFRNANIATASGTGISIIFLSIIYYAMTRELAAKRRAEASLSRLNAGLEKRIARATHDLRMTVEKYRRAAETSSAVINASALPIVGLDCERHVVIWNRAAERVFGHGAEKAVAGECLPVVDDDPSALGSILEAIEAGEHIRDRPIRYRANSGAVYDLVLFGTPLHDASGQPHGLVLVLEDITQRKSLEQHSRHTQKMEALGQLTDGIAHDFNNLLGIVIGNLELLDDFSEAHPEIRAPLTDALEASTQGVELVRRLQTFARRQPLQPRVVDINDLLRGIAITLRHTLPESIAIEVLAGKEPAWAVVDPTQLEDSIIGLCINARDALPHGGRLKIESCIVQLGADIGVAPDDYVMLAIEDDGVGMPPPVLERALDPFFTTKDTNQHSGLGLSLVYGFVKQSNGHVRISSDNDLGTTVRLYLPLVTADPPAAAVSPITHASPPPTGKETILLVEDNVHLRRTVARQLVELGYEVREADDVGEALRLLDGDGVIDLLLSDVVMPGELDGYELARKAISRRPSLRVLLMSGYTTRVSAAPGDEEQGPELLNKPFRKNELAVKLRSVLDANA